MIRVARFIIAAAVAGLVVVRLPGAGEGRVAPSLPTPPFRLAILNPCFFAPTPGPTRWPLSPTGGVHPIQGSFNEPRGSAAHFGVDIPSADRAPVFAIVAGHVAGEKPHHLSVLTGGGVEFYYWHTDHLPGVVVGSRVQQGELIGHVAGGIFHLHVGEHHRSACGWVNPMRPTGPFVQTSNQERPTIGGLHAYRATAAAFEPFMTETDPSLQTDPATPESLDALHGVVDLRSRVYDWPTNRMTDRRQLELMPAAIRAWLAPAGNPSRHVGRLKLIYDGAGLLTSDAVGTTLFHVWAFGTWHQGIGYRRPGMPPDKVGADFVWHVGGTVGLHTTRYPNGAYTFCVQALTINGVRGIRCTPVTIAN